MDLNLTVESQRIFPCPQAARWSSTCDSICQCCALLQTATFINARHRYNPSNYCSVEVPHQDRSHQSILSDPFHGILVHTRSAMGMPESETALEESYVATLYRKATTPKMICTVVLKCSTTSYMKTCS